MSQDKTVVYGFGSFRLNPSRWVLERGGETVPLTPRAFDTLLALVENRGRVMTKEELFQTVWKGAFVDENNLSQAISAVRKALGDGANGDRYIATVPRRGYSFVAPVTSTPVAEGALAPPLPELPPVEAPAAGEPKPSPSPRARAHPLRWIFAGTLLLLLLVVWIARDPGKRDAPALAGVRSIAVLPFSSLGPSQPGDYLGLGIAEAIVARLVRSPSLVVRPVSSARLAAAAGGDAVAAGRRLGTDGILEGTLERGGGRVRAAVSLIRVGDGRVLWSDSFDELESEPFLLEDAISDRLVRALAVRIAPSEAKRVAVAAPRREAYEAYLKGRYFWNRRTNEGFLEALREFEAALAADPHYAPAWSGIADARVLLGPDKPGEFRLAREAAEKALAIDPDLAEAHASLAMAKFFGEWDFTGAEREFRRALHLAPGYATAHHWYAYWLLAMGRFDEAIREIRRAREIDPTSLAVNRDVGHILGYARRYDEAAAALRDTLRMDPSYRGAREFLVMDLSYAGRPEEASAEVRTLAAIPGEIGAKNFEAVIEARAGHPDALRRLLPEKLRAAESGEVGSDSVALDYVWLGEKDEAFRWLDRALREHRFYLVFLKADPVFDPLRGDPRFAALLRKVGLS